jgi:hypothetical protein
MKRGIFLVIPMSLIIIFLSTGFVSAIETEYNLSYGHSYILEDDMFDEDSTRDGTETFMVADFIEGTGEVSFLKWNISGIPTDANITNATLCLTTYHSNPSYASNEPVEVWYSDNETWSEGDIDSMCGNGVACDELWGHFTSLLTTYPGGIDAVVGTDCISDLGEGINYAISNGSSSVTFILNHTGDASDYYEWGSKESTYDDKPYLNITYNRDVSLTINLNSPTNGASEEPGNVNFNWTAFGDNSSYLCNLTIDGLVNVSNIPTQNNTATTTNISFTNEIVHSWNVTCWNGSNSETSETRDLTIATIYDDITFNASFEGGNLANISYISGNSTGYRRYSAEMNYTTGTGHDTYHFWFYFGMHNTTNKSIQVDIINCLQIDEDSNRWDHVKATYSFDNNLTWNRTTNTTTPNSNFTHQYHSTDNNYTINITSGENNEIFIASNYPYPYTRFHQDYLLPKNSSKYANVSLLGLSEGGRNVTMITITDSNYNDSEKHKIFLLGGQHVSGEEQGVWNARGTIDFLLNETNETAAKLRQDYIFKIVPLMDVFASVTGRGRYSKDWLDPNRQWNSTESDNLLPVNYTKKEIETFNPDLFIDFHGMISNEENQHYYPSGGQSEVGIMNNISLFWPETGSRIAQSTKGLASVAIDDEFGILSLTLETAISATSAHSTRTNEDWTNDGKSVVRGIYSYFGNADATFINIAPNIPSPNISSTDRTNTTSSDLNCSAIITDSNEDTLNVTTKWYVNETLNLTSYHNNSYSNGSLFNTTLSSTYTAPQETWFCSMQVCDNHSNCTTWQNSSTILILEDSTTPPSTPPSSSSGIDYNIGDTENLDETKDLRKRDKLIFTHNEKNHWLKIENIKRDYIDISIHSEPILDSLYIGESKNYDIDQNEELDITISLNSITNNKANLNIKEYSLPVTAPGDCLENWKCSDWKVCNQNSKERTCLDENKCGTNEGKPIEIVACEQYSPDFQEAIKDSFEKNTYIWMTSLLLIIITVSYVVLTSKKDF